MTVRPSPAALAGPMRYLERSLDEVEIYNLLDADLQGAEVVIDDPAGDILTLNTQIQRNNVYTRLFHAANPF